MNFFWNILLKKHMTIWYDIQLQNYGVINFVPFFLDHPVYKNSHHLLHIQSVIQYFEIYLITVF